MESRKLSGASMPLRTAPLRPTVPSKYAPVVGWNDEPFSNDPFEPYSCIEKKKPPPRPPPPKISKSQGEPRPSHFNRRPTILSTLLNRKPKDGCQNVPEDNKCDSSVDFFAMQPQQNGGFVSNTTTTGVLIDFSSPPSSPTFTTRSSSDGLSIDSFGSDVTSSTHNHNVPGGNVSQTESGFEDDFDLFSSRKPGSSNGDPSDPWGNCDPFSPPKVHQKPALPKKPVLFLDKSDFVDPLCNGKTVLPKVATHKIPTIIRSKPARPKPPDNSALLKSTLGSITPSSTSTHKRLLKQENIVSFPISFEDEFPSTESSPEREPSPPMPTVPPPPPPVLDDEDGHEGPLPPVCSHAHVATFNPNGIPNATSEDEESYAIAAYDFNGTHSDDLPFTIGTKVRLLRKVNEEWMYGRLRNGMEGVFPVSYVEVKVPFKATTAASNVTLAKAMYEFSPQQSDDLGLSVGSIVKVTGKVSDEWLLGECNGLRGQFPANYIEYLP